MRKRDLKVENHELKIKISQQEREKEELRTCDTYERDRQLIRLGLIPDRYITTPETITIYFLDTGEPVINWHRVKQDLKDLETYNACQNGHHIAKQNNDTQGDDQ